MSASYQISWSKFQKNISEYLQSMLAKDFLTDVSLYSGNQTWKVHRVVLCANSGYFEQLLRGLGKYQHPVLVLDHIHPEYISYLLEYIYTGNINIEQGKVQQFIQVSKMLQIRGISTDPFQPKPNDNEPPDDLKPYDHMTLDDHRREQDDQMTLNHGRMTLNDPSSNLDDPRMPLDETERLDDQTDNSQQDDSTDNQNSAPENNTSDIQPRSTRNLKRRRMYSLSRNSVKAGSLPQDKSSENIRDQPENILEATAEAVIVKSETFVEVGLMQQQQPGLDQVEIKIDPDASSETNSSPVNSESLEQEQTKAGSLTVRNDLLPKGSVSIQQHKTVKSPTDVDRCHFCSQHCGSQALLTAHLKTVHMPAKHALCENCENFFHVCAIVRHRTKCQSVYQADTS